MLINIKPYHWTILPFFLLQFSAVGQNRSFTKTLDNFDESDVISQKIDSAEALFDTDAIAAFEQVESAVAFAIEMGYRQELADAYFTLAEFNVKMGEYNSAALHSKRALAIYYTYESWGEVYASHLLLGESYLALNDYENAIFQYKKAAFLAQKGNEKEAYLEAKLEVASIKLLQGKDESAETILQEIKSEATELQRSDLVAEADFKLGERYEQIGETTIASDYYEIAQDNAIQTKNSTLLNKTNERIVQNYTESTEEVDLDDQVLYNTLNESETYFLDIHDTALLVANGIQKADILTKKGDYQGAASQLTYSYDLSERSGDLDMQLNSSKKLYDVYSQSKNAEGAVRAYENYMRLLDSTNRLQEQQKGLTDRNSFALKTVEKQIDNLEQERQLDQQTIQLLEREQNLNNEALSQQRTWLYVFGFILILFLAASVFVYRNIKAKKRAHQLLYLKSLRAQMNPHFIFNSLNSVNNYISKSDERAANKYLAKFSKLMRQVLEYSQLEFISLTKEVEVLGLYVELEHERFKDKFEFRFTVDESINTDSYTIPPMLVQPFIENAIWHGLRYKEEPGGLLEILFSDKGDHVEITVQDNGIGRKKSQELKTINQKKHNSSGMKNVENRTELIQAVFKTKISQAINDLPNNGGTQVTIKLYQNE